MTGSEMVEAAARCGLRIQDLAKLFKVTRKAVEHWAAGRNKVPKRVIAALRDIEKLDPERRLNWLFKQIGKTELGAK